jgi:asparagine synthase (glutamine-hydrolysing)
MCGIWTYIKLLNKQKLNYSQLYNDFMNLQHRGPDLSNFQIFKDNICIGFHRLAIMDPAFHANQPYIIEDNERTIVFICNGEIYNFKELIKNYNLEIYNNSDCMTIPYLYIKLTNDCDISKFCELFSNKIKGEFAFILLEFDKLKNIKNVIVGRDQIGIRPLYYHYPDNNSSALIFSSEIKGTSSFLDPISEFSPGHIMNIKLDNFGCLNTIDTFDFRTIYNITPFSPISYNLEYENYYLEKIKNAVINSVKRRLTSDQPVAFLLSGGVDSSLIAAIAAKILNQPIDTYCCGMHEGTDLLYARKVANHIGSNHHEVLFSPEEGLNTIKDVIYTTESWDTTTIRASVGQYLVCKYIGTKTNAKVVLVGEGPDEVCSSYLFNYHAPSGEELHNTAMEYVSKIHMFDGKRADRCISRWGLEGRIPLLDPEFIEAYWSLPSEWRHPNYKGIEKWWLRKAFENSGILPNDVLWRKKEAFSDGISSQNKSWFEIIQEFVNLNIDGFIQDNENPSIEAFYYKKIFISFFGEARLNIIPHYWQPKWINNSNSYLDPSARTLNVYNNV